MKRLLAILTPVALAAACPAGAVSYSLGTIDSGPVDVTSTYGPGYKLFTFDDGTSPFTGGAVRSGTVLDQYVAPAGDTTPYFSIGPSTTSPATLAFQGVSQLSFYWGSIDTYNVITFDGIGQSFDGSAFGGTNSLVYRPSREVTFYFSPAEASALTGLRLSSSVNAFELDNLIFGSAVPEPGTWALMILGFGGVGLVLRRRRKIVARTVRAM